MMKKIAILGSTGSIGTQTLEVVRYNKDIQVTALAAGSNVKLLEEQIREFKPRLACLWDEEKAKELRAAVADMDVKVASGMEGLMEAAVSLEADLVVTAVVGMIGIRPTIAAMEAGKDIALANKETLVYHHASCQGKGREAAAGRFGALCYIPMLTGSSRQSPSQNTAHCLRRSVPGIYQGAAGKGPAGGRVKASQLVHGA